jgi:hypothetical protein
MEANVKERLYRLVDGLPDGAVDTVEHFLESLSNPDDPVVRALMDAPKDDEPLTDEDRVALEEAQAAIEAGDVVSDEALREELGL